MVRDAGFEPANNVDLSMIKNYSATKSAIDVARVR
jgi:hypothetical protein